MQGLAQRSSIQQLKLPLVAVLALASLSNVAFCQMATVASPAQGVSLYDSIAVARSEPGSSGSGFRVRPSNDLEASNTTLLEIIAFAYNVHPKRIVNAPIWADQIAFDLKLHYAGDGVPDDAACKEMLKHALKERFGLVLHGGGEDAPSYAIHVEPAGATLARSMAMPGTLPGLAMSAPGKLQAHNASISDLAATLQRSVLDRPVIDETGIKGRWDFQLTWVPAPSEYSGKAARMAPPSSKSLAEEMKRELGLRLDPATTSASNMILDHVQMPAGI